MSVSSQDMFGLAVFSYNTSNIHPFAYNPLGQLHVQVVGNLGVMCLQRVDIR